MATKRPYKHSPEESEGEQPWTIHVPVKPPFKWEPRQPEPDDPMFGTLHIASVNPPKPSTDDSAEPKQKGSR